MNGLLLLIIAFGGGLVSFFNPCVAPLMPGFLSYMAGTSITDASKRARLRNAITSVFFVLGFALVFSATGVLISYFATSIEPYLRALQIVGGIVIIVFGLALLDVVPMPMLKREFKLRLKRQHMRYPGAFLFGMVFAVGWTPCIGPVLGSILTLAAINPGWALAQMIAYSLGLGLPFFLTGLFLHEALGLVKRSDKVFRWFNWIVGVLLIFLGVLLVTGWFQPFSGFVNGFVLSPADHLRHLFSHR